MTTLEIRRHSLRKNTGGSQLSQEGVDLARKLGESMGPFAVVATSVVPRARETALAMGFAVDQEVVTLSSDEEGHHARPAPAEPAPAWWRQPVAELKQEIEWLHTKSEEMVDYLVLPVLQVAAAALNFGMVLVASRQVFKLPFKSRSEITQTWDILRALHVQPPPRKQATL